ncbi:MAG: hypothetical protein MK110_05715 [Fuerstiella sp.]|nr:hypothetical protein [Fuerstiella sp.]
MTGLVQQDDEIPAGFQLRDHQDQSLKRHAIHKEKRHVPRCARYVDAGETWTLKNPQGTTFSETCFASMPPVITPGNS